MRHINRDAICANPSDSRWISEISIAHNYDVRWNRKNRFASKAFVQCCGRENHQITFSLKWCAAGGIEFAWREKKVTIKTRGILWFIRNRIRTEMKIKHQAIRYRLMLCVLLLKRGRKFYGGKYFTFEHSPICYILCFWGFFMWCESFKWCWIKYAGLCAVTRMWENKSWMKICFNVTYLCWKLKGKL